MGIREFGNDCIASYSKRTWKKIAEIQGFVQGLLGYSAGPVINILFCLM